MKIEMAVVGLHGSKASAYRNSSDRLQAAGLVGDGRRVDGSRIVQRPDHSRHARPRRRPGRRVVHVRALGGGHGKFIKHAAVTGVRPTQDDGWPVGGEGQATASRHRVRSTQLAVHLQSYQLCDSRARERVTRS